MDAKVPVIANFWVFIAESTRRPGCLPGRLILYVIEQRIVQAAKPPSMDCKEPVIMDPCGPATNAVSSATSSALA